MTHHGESSHVYSESSESSTGGEADYQPGNKSRNAAFVGIVGNEFGITVYHRRNKKKFKEQIVFLQKETIGADC